jgi:hypothetical protein
MMVLTMLTWGGMGVVQGSPWVNYGMVMISVMIQV